MRHFSHLPWCNFFFLQYRVQHVKIIRVAINLNKFLVQTQLRSHFCFSNIWQAGGTRDPLQVPLVSVTNSSWGAAENSAHINLKCVLNVFGQSEQKKYTMSCCRFHRQSCDFTFILPSEKQNFSCKQPHSQNMHSCGRNDKLQFCDGTWCCVGSSAW